MTVGSLTLRNGRLGQARRPTQQAKTSSVERRKTEQRLRSSGRAAMYGECARFSRKPAIS